MNVGVVHSIAFKRSAGLALHKYYWCNPSDSLHGSYMTTCKLPQPRVMVHRCNLH